MKLGSLIFSVVVGLLAPVLLFGSWYTVDQGERGVILRNGAVVGTADAGLHFKTPLIDSIKYVSTQSHSTVYPGVQAYSKDQQTATLKISVNYQIPAGEVETVYSQFGSVEGVQARLLDRQVPTQAENVFGGYTAVEAVQHRVKLVADITAALKSAVVGPIIITSVQVENIDFSSAYEKSIEDRMKAEVLVQTEKQNLEKEKVAAEIAVTTAKGEADSNLARAEAKAKATRLQGDAEAAAIRAKSQALAENKDLVELTKAEKWNGVLPTTMVPNNAVPFLEVGKK